MKKILIVIIILANYHSLIGQTLIGQTYSGTVLNKETNEPIQYVSVGIINKNVGTIASEKGQFNIQIENKYLNDSIRFSMIGYESQTFLVSSFINNDSKNNIKIYLNKKSYTLSTVVIRPKKIKQKTVGNLISSHMVVTGIFDSIVNILGYERGTLMKIPKAKCNVDDIRIQVVQSDYDYIKFRINIYTIDSDEKFNCILKEPIYYYLPKTPSYQDIVIDLKKYGLIVESNFVVTMEVVEYSGKGGLYFLADLLGSPSYKKKASQGVWEKKSYGIGISSTITYEK